MWHLSFFYRSLLKLLASYRASFRMWDCTQTRKRFTLCQPSSICPNTPSLNSSRTSATTSSTTDASKSWATVEVWMLVTTGRRSCSQAPKTQSPVRMEQRRFSSPRRAPMRTRGCWSGLRLPTPLRHPREPARLRRRTKLTVCQVVRPGALRPVPESQLNTRGRDLYTETMRRSQR